MQLRCYDKDAFVRQSCSSAFGRTDSVQPEMRLRRWNRIFGTVFESDFQNADVELAKLSRVKKSEAGRVHVSTQQFGIIVMNFLHHEQ